jgi:acetyl esterase/lipase
MRYSWLTLLTICAAAHSLRAQAVTPALLEARAVPPADTTISTVVGNRTLITELRVPPGAGPHPVVVVIHGGCWITKLADARYMRPLAEALRQAGFATLNISYRRADEPGGAWPGTFLDVESQTALVTKLAPRYRLDTRRVLVAGHSSGAHLALWLASLHKLPRTSAIHEEGVLVPIAGVVAIDGPGDLLSSSTAIGRICSGSVLEQLLGGSASDQPERWRQASPSEWLPLGVPQAMVRGGMDVRIPGLGSPEGDMVRYAARARAAGDSAWVVTADTMSHFSMLDPQHPAFQVVLDATRKALAAVRPR